MAGSSTKRARAREAHTASVHPTPDITSSVALAADEPRHIQRVFEALASAARRKILAYLSAGSLTAGEIAARFDMTKPSVSQHLSVLEAAGLVAKEKRGQFVHYSLVETNLVNTLNGYVQGVCPVARPLKREAAARRAGKGNE